MFRIKKLTVPLYIILFGLLMIYQPNAQESEPNKDKLEVVCSKNIEVFCTLINLTDYWKDRHTDFPFAAEAREKFLPFRNHQAVDLTSEFLKKQ